MTLVMGDLHDGIYMGRTGNLFINGNIGDHVTIKVFGGSLTIRGNVGKNCKILVNACHQGRRPKQAFYDAPDNQLAKKSANFFRANRTPQKKQAPFIRIYGQVEEHLKIKTDTADVFLHNSVGEGLNILSGTGNVDILTPLSQANIHATSGHVFVKYVASGTKIKTDSGSIFFKQMVENGFVATKTGTIIYEKRSPDSTLFAHTGKIHWLPKDTDMSMPQPRATL